MNRHIFKNPTVISNPRLPPEELDEEQISQNKASEWDQYFDEHKMITVDNGDEFSVYTAGKRVNNKPIIFFLHGAGHTSMTFSPIAKILKKDYYVMSYDFRGHGKTVCKDPNELSAENLVEDCYRVINSYFGEDIPKICLCGHSLGGSIAARVVQKQKLGDKISGLILIDVVEGTAMEALPKMQIFLNQRPKKFTSVEQAIHWGVKSGMVQSHESAKISIPSQIKKVDNHYTWNVDLSQSEQYWKGWFEDLSNIFLSSKIPKMLILAGAERLDTPLTIAQMQGKYQLVVHPTCGHMIQEDAPDKVVQNIKHFYQRFW